MIKLTLSIPESVLATAKAYSKKNRQSLSSLVSHYFTLLAQRDRSIPSMSTRLIRATGLVHSDRCEEDILFDALTEKYR